MNAGASSDSLYLETIDKIAENLLFRAKLSVKTVTLRILFLLKT